MPENTAVDREEDVVEPTAQPTPLRPDAAAVGPSLLPIARLRVMSATEWEDFVLEWAQSLKGRYARVRRSSGAGDLGRDVIGYVTTDHVDPWDNHQCKHYSSPLAPSHIWAEIGKLCWHTWRGAYTVPRKYIFVSPWGAGPSLANLLDSPAELKAQFLANWDRYCRTEIRATSIDMTTELLEHIESLDFSIFESASPLTLIDDHRSTPYYVARFGGGLPERPPVPEPPLSATEEETTYVRALLDAYEERYGATYGTAVDLVEPDAVSHLARSRREFYSAEALREFSRDNVPGGTYEALVDEVHEGVVDVVEMAHVDGFERVLKVVAQAKSLNLTSNALLIVTRPSDRGGICHQLANDMRLRWRK